MKNFTHLHLHTSYSINSGTIKIDHLIDIAKKHKIKSLAISDYLNIFGAIKFYNKCIAASIKPIIGCEIPIIETNHDYLGTIVLLCKNEKGYHNLNKILSKIHTRESDLGANFSLLENNSSDLVCLSGGRNGILGINALKINNNHLENYVTKLSNIYDNRFYIEIDRTQRENEIIYNNKALSISAQYDLPVVASNDVLFISESDFEANEVKVAINKKTKLNDRTNQKEFSPEQYLKTGDTMKEIFSDIPSALINVEQIVKQCNFKLPKFKYHLPKFPNPSDMDDSAYFEKVCYEGLEDYFDSSQISNKNDYRVRLKSEIEVIQSMKFTSYFLIVQEFILWAKDNDVPVGPGRGSGAGSLVAFVLKITNIDPIKYNLLFERFLNPERISMPDFDIDFCMNKRQKVIDHIVDTYGQDKVSQIITYNTLSARAVIRDVGRVLNLSYGFVDTIAKLIPFTPGITINEALKVSRELSNEYKTKDDVKSMIDLAKKIEGLPRGVGTHAAGIVIAPSSITDYMPIYSLEDKDELITQFDKDDIESIGLVKFDILGLTTLTVMDDAIKLVLLKDKNFNINSIKLDDQKVFTILKNKRTTGIFQLESLGMKKYMSQLQPDRFEDIVALVALYRPGPLGTNMVDDFIANKHGREVEYEHPLLKNILAETHGLILYQEQVMEIARILGKYTLGEADVLRRAMGKKKQKEMEDHRSRFISGCKENNISISVSQSIFDKMEKFAGYGFNKSHSVAYAMLSYQTAYLKAYYPNEFFSASLSSVLDDTNKIINLISSCNDSNIIVKSPDINESKYKFIPQDVNYISYGLGAIKGVGENAADHIEEVRRKEKFTSLEDFCCRVNLSIVNSGTIEALIASGSFDNISECSRSENISNISKLISYGNKRQTDIASGQNELFADNNNNKTSTTPTSKYNEILTSNELKHERKVLGYYLTSHPIRAYIRELDNMKLKNISNINNIIISGNPSRMTSTVAGVIIDSRYQRISKNNYITIYKVDDGSHQINISFFDDKIIKYKNILIEDEILFFNGEIYIDEYDSQLSMRADNVFSLDAARQKFAKSMQITIPTENMSKEKILQIKSLLDQNIGDTHVNLIFKTRDFIAPLASKNNIHVSLSDSLITQIKTLVGEKAIEIKYH